jgi:dynactin-6
MTDAGVESPTVGSHNIFGPRSRVAWTVSVGSHCNIGPGCTVLPNPFGTAFVGASRGAVSGGDEGKTDVLDSAQTDVDTTTTDAVEGSSDVPPPPPPTVERTESLPDYTVVFGSENRRRIWTGEGEMQAAALHTKHLEYLREAIPKYHKLKLFPASTPL